MSGWRNCISADATDGFTVRVGHDPDAPHPGHFYIGFVAPDVFRPRSELLHMTGVYTLCPMTGWLYGSGCSGIPYSVGFTSAVLRCVADREARVITFHVDGVVRKVAWSDVPPGPLHAFVSFYWTGSIVELLLCNSDGPP